MDWQDSRLVPQTNQGKDDLIGQKLSKGELKTKWSHTEAGTEFHSITHINS